MYTSKFTIYLTAKVSNNTGSGELDIEYFGQTDYNFGTSVAIENNQGTKITEVLEQPTHL